MSGYLITKWRGVGVYSALHPRAHGGRTHHRTEAVPIAVCSCSLYSEAPWAQAQMIGHDDLHSPGALSDSVKAGAFRIKMTLQLDLCRSSFPTGEISTDDGLA